MATPAKLATPDVAQIKSFFTQAHGELEEMLSDTSRLLADLTQYASVVTGPPHEAALVRSVPTRGPDATVGAHGGGAVQRRGRQAVAGSGP